MGLPWQGWGYSPALVPASWGSLETTLRGSRTEEFVNLGRGKLRFSKFKVVKRQILRFLIFYDGAVWDSEMRVSV